MQIFIANRLLFVIETKSNLVPQMQLKLRKGKACGHVCNYCKRSLLFINVFVPCLIRYM